jgi:hypothetical protein
MGSDVIDKEGDPLPYAGLPDNEVGIGKNG